MLFDRRPKTVCPACNMLLRGGKRAAILSRESGLPYLERAEHLRRRKEIYERLHPETRRGGDRGNQYSGGKRSQNDNLVFSRSAAPSTGQSGRTIQQLIRKGAAKTRCDRGPIQVGADRNVEGCRGAKIRAVGITGGRQDGVPDISVVNSINRQVHSSACL
jgi:hypothetical protein